MTRRSESWSMTTGSEIIATRCGSMIRMFFRSLANQSSYRRSTTFIKTPCERGWWSEQRIIGGPALVFGTSARVKMNP
jgi:hypothetical protein